jgi:hypothetical protein
MHTPRKKITSIVLPHPSTTAATPSLPVAMSDDLKPFIVHQNVFNQAHSPILVTPVHESSSKAARVALDIFMQSVTTTAVGIAAAYTRCTLSALAFATNDRVYLLKLSTSRKQVKRPKAQVHHPVREALSQALLCQPELRKLGLNVDRLVTSLYLDVDLRLSGGVDILVFAAQKKNGHGSIESIAEALGGWSAFVTRDQLVSTFRSEEFDMKNLANLAMRAWVSFRAGTAVTAIHAMESASVYDTLTFSETVSMLSLL